MSKDKLAKPPQPTNETPPPEPIDTYAEEILLDKTPPPEPIDAYAEEISLDKTPPPEPIDAYAEEISLDKTPRPKTFHSKNFVDNETPPREPELKTKLSHAETSGVVISAVMLIYSLAEQDKPLFFLSTALLIFLLRPLIGALAGKHNRAVQNALHSFSVVLFIGALLFLFL
ncbi:MAG: hypothetical protein IJL12_03435 [Selenomonadaceae bacterium]|nr:hypothetical protein [Selenomonadaceae bacterium]MBQ6131376.1 hypothetical protein [Selenomonadaceae bacterium]